jgi:hypothetical protein
VDRAESMLRLFTAGWTKEEGILLFDLKDSVSSTMRKRKDVRSGAFMNNLGATSDALANSLDAVNRMADFPMTYRSALAVPSLLLNCSLDTDIILDLETFARSRNTSFSTAHFIPHGYGVLQQARGLTSTTNERNIQSLMGESTTKTTKVDTTTLCEGKIDGPEAIVGMCANITAALLTLVDFDPSSTKQKEVPFLHWISRSIALAHTSKDVRDYRKKRQCNALSDYYAFNVINRMMVTTAKLLQDEESITAASPKNASARRGDVQTKHFDIAGKAFTKSMDHIRGYAGDAETCDVTDIWKSSMFNVTTGHAEAAGNKRDRDRGGDEEDRESPAKKKGNADPRPVIVFGSKLLKMPNEEDYPDGEKTLCAPALRNGSRGCKNRDCKKNHLGPKKWSRALMGFMKAWMAEDDRCTMKWNPEVMTPTVLNMEYSNDKAKGAKVTKKRK